MPERDALDWDSNRSSNFLINNRLQTIVSNPLLLKSRRMNIIMMTASTSLTIGKGKQLPLLCVTCCANEQQVIPIVSQPVITWILFFLSRSLLYSSLWTIVLHGTIRSGKKLGFAIAAFIVLSTT